MTSCTLRGSCRRRSSSRAGRASSSAASRSSRRCSRTRSAPRPPWTTRAVAAHVDGGAAEAGVAARRAHDHPAAAVWQRARARAAGVTAPPTPPPPPAAPAASARPRRHPSRPARRSPAEREAARASTWAPPPAAAAVRGDDAAAARRHAGGGDRPLRRPRGERVADRHGGGPARNFGRAGEDRSLDEGVRSRGCGRGGAARRALDGRRAGAAGDWGRRRSGSTVPMVATGVAVALAALALRSRGGDHQAPQVGAAAVPVPDLAPELMRDPVTTADGHPSYARRSERWLCVMPVALDDGRAARAQAARAGDPLRQLIQSQRRHSGAFTHQR